MNNMDKKLFNENTETIWNEYKTEKHTLFYGVTRNILVNITNDDIIQLLKTIDYTDYYKDNKELIIKLDIDHITNEPFYSILSSIDKGIYRHFKEQFYEVIDCALDATNGNEGTYYVVYKALYGDNKLYVRKLSEFISDVDLNKHPLTKQRKTFRKVQFENIEKRNI